MKGAFNDAIVSLAPGTDPKPVIAELDRLLEPYGSVGAIERRDQPSNRFLEDELNQQKVMSIDHSLHLSSASRRFCSMWRSAGWWRRSASRSQP